LCRINNTGKFGENIIPGGVNQPPPVLLNQSGYHFPIERDGTHCRHLIFTHKSAVACGISTEDRGKFAFEAFGVHWIASKNIIDVERLTAKVDDI
jgi:hypothetical protein